MSEGPISDPVEPIIDEPITGGGDNEIDQPGIKETKFVFSLLQCSSSNLFGCFENFLLTVGVVAAIYFAQIAVKRIMKDRNEMLEIWEKIVIVLCFAALVIEFVLFGVNGAHVWQISIRSLLFASSIFTCEYVFSLFPFEESARLNALKLLRLSFAYVFGLWFFCGFLHKNNASAPYNCTRIDWLLISGSNLIVTCISSYMSLNIIQTIKDNQQRLESAGQTPPPANYSQLNGKGSDSRKQAQLTWLMIGNFFPIFAQFFWDYYAHTHSGHAEDCNMYFFSHSFLSMLAFLVLKAIVFFGPPASVFFVFYWLNREDINTVNENPNGQFFYDRRSEVIEKYSF